MNLSGLLVFHCILTMNHVKVHQINSFLSCVCVIRTSFLFGKSLCDLSGVQVTWAFRLLFCLQLPKCPIFPWGYTIWPFDIFEGQWYYKTALWESLFWAITCKVNKENQGFRLQLLPVLAQAKVMLIRVIFG